LRLLWAFDCDNLFWTSFKLLMILTEKIHRDPQWQDDLPRLSQLLRYDIPASGGRWGQILGGIVARRSCDETVSWIRDRIREKPLVDDNGTFIQNPNEPDILNLRLIIGKLILGLKSNCFIVNF